LDEGAKGGKWVVSKEGNMDTEPIQTKFMQVLPVHQYFKVGSISELR